ncbi:MAG: hypothetical protein U0167_19595 [bacterium]
MDAPITQAEMPPGGISGMIFLVPAEREGTRSDDQRLRDPSEREFTVHICLATDRSHSSGIDIRPGCASGSSLLRLPPGASSGKLQTPACAFRLTKGEDGSVGGLVGSLRDRSIQGATRQAMAAAAPVLDLLSYRVNVPLVVGRIACVDASNGVTAVTFTSPYGDAVIPIDEGHVHREMMPVFALYREAKNSVSPFYRFLCYYKILEGILNVLRPAVFKEARRRRFDLKTIPEVLPDHPEFHKLPCPYVGQPIASFVNDELRPKYRNAVAHFREGARGVLNPSDLAREGEFADVILPAELAVRVTVDAQGSYYDQLRSCGA